MDVDQPEASTSASTNASIEARPLPLPSTPFYVVEYPGRVKPTSVPEAVKTLGGLGSLENAFKRGATKAETLVELHLRPDNPFAHPIPGSVVASNALLMKVVKRKKKRRHPGDPVVGHYTTEVVGVIPKTVRFRSKDSIHTEMRPELMQPRHGGLSVPARYGRLYKQATDGHGTYGWYVELPYSCNTCIHLGRSRCPV